MSWFDCAVDSIYPRHFWRRWKNYFRQKKNAGGQNRTADTRIFSPLLYRLSYPGIKGRILPD